MFVCPFIMELAINRTIQGSTFVDNDNNAVSIFAKHDMYLYCVCMSACCATCHAVILMLLFP